MLDYYMISLAYLSLYQNKHISFVSQALSFIVGCSGQSHHPLYLTLINKPENQQPHKFPARILSIR
jgi:hypothetical protein